MRKLDLKSVTQYVENNIEIFHEKRIQSIARLKLYTVLQRKSPYLFKAKYLLTAEQIIKAIIDAHISSNEETIFGDWLEGLAIFINEKVYDGRKSGIPCIDLEFDSEKVRYIVTIKSGPNRGNSKQITQMKTCFNTARKILRTSNSKINVVAINGCCYGRDKNPDKGEYFKYCGQQFWEFLSDNSDLYLEIIEPLGHKAKEKSHEFLKSYSQLINKFTKGFIDEFCMEDGSINWPKIVEINSSISVAKDKRNKN